jgi:hypothetical protein
MRLFVFVVTGVVLLVCSLFYFFGMPAILSYGEDRLFAPQAMFIGSIGLCCIFAGATYKGDEE